MRYPDDFLWRGAFPHIPLSIASKYFSKNFDLKKSTLLYLKLLLNSLYGAYADPANRRSISDTFARAE